MALRVCIDTRDMCTCHAIGKRAQPTLRLPLFGVGSPDCRISVDATDVAVDSRALGYEYLRDHLPVNVQDGFLKRQDVILSGTVVRVSTHDKRS